MKHRVEPEILISSFYRSNNKRVQPPGTIDPVIRLQFPRMPIHQSIHTLLHLALS